MDILPFLRVSGKVLVFMHKLKLFDVMLSIGDDFFHFSFLSCIKTSLVLIFLNSNKA